ncbi:hypothetical protein J4G48_0046040 [Bradyrhizobium barranii subsp. apii]|uniref:hypothetical protein n=1 Tax=Bradyrhizobium barranii TaxID=2992140 RepID=UPI001AA1A3A9|nr:hypothetical protein [Bradyrhizobium barranii]UPT96301.1 hypothetical protein J4G48_0046040 [Bradyrhizobium barranii subsp. apii]
MNINLPSPAHYALVCPQDFSSRMNDYWTSARPIGLGQHSSAPLKTLWRIMGENFKAAIEEAAIGVQSPWRILQPPTGSGKTQGTCVYAAMQAQQNLESNLKPVGMLVVTRLIEEADKIRDTINAIAGRPVAVVSHSSNTASPEALQTSDAVVITHAAFLNARRDLKADKWAAWERLVSWRGGKRLLTVIDEALANVVDESSATADNLAFVLGIIPPAIRQALPEQVQVLEQVYSVLLAYVSEQDGDSAMSMIWGEKEAPGAVDLSPLRAAMGEVRYDRLVGNRSSHKNHAWLAARVAETLEAVQSCLDQFAYYAKEGKYHSINSAALAVPLNTPGPVVLDATAKSNFLWDLFEERHVCPPVPSHARDYTNVTLHVARGTRLGKNAMIEHIKDRLPRVRRSVEEALGDHRSLFVCAHKDVEDTVTKRWSEKSAMKVGVGHWNAVDGRNDWQDFDAALILGLPYRPQTWATNMFCALQGSQDDKWLQSPEWKQFKNVRKEMERRQMSVSVIQAINRICCRHVIDAEGNCPRADIFIVLPQDAMGEAVLDAIKADMPGIAVRQWDFDLDPPKGRSPRESSHTRLIAYMEEQPAGTVSLTEIQHSLKLTSIKKLRETLNAADHPTTQALADMGVTYVAGVGRGSKSFLMKAA